MTTTRWYNLLVVVVLLGTVAMTGAVASPTAGPANGWQQDLSPAQRAQLHALIHQMAADGKSADEIWKECKQQLNDWGDDNTPPEPPEGNNPSGWYASLTAAQQQQIMALVQQMWTAGDTLQAIWAAVNNLLSTWGVSSPPPLNGSLPQWLGVLTPAEATQVATTIASLWAQGDTLAQIWTAVTALYKSWGLPAPPMPSADIVNAVNKLTAAQRQQLITLVAGMWTKGDSLQQIWTAARALLASWGLVSPPPPGPPGDGNGNHYGWDHHHHFGGDGGDGNGDGNGDGGGGGGDDGGD